MERIAKAFRARGRQGALIPFLSAGDPDYDTSLQLFQSVLAAGADILEIGIPYSDPLADGPVIQAASLRSLNAGFSLPRAFDIVRSLRQDTEKAMVLFTYINPVLQFGADRFFAEASRAGADGAIIPDLPYEESQEIRDLADKHGIALIPLVSPVSSPERIASICRDARGFVYLVSTLGVTGERQELSSRVEGLAKTVRRLTDLPVAVGFGVSRPEHAQQIMRFADGVIVGSAFIRKVEEGILQSPSGAPGQAAQAASHVGAFAKSFREAMDQSASSTNS